MTTLERISQPTPKFFQAIRNAGLILAGLSTALITAPITLPEVVTNIAGYIAVAGGVMTAVSQTAVKNEKE